MGVKWNLATKTPEFSISSRAGKLYEMGKL
jgi:hypothetical protein